MTDQGATQRVYGGQSAHERVEERRRLLVVAGTDLLASPGGPQDFGVRAVCRAAGLASRYFYESFADAGALAGAIYDETVTALAGATLRAIEGLDDDLEAAVRTGLDALVGHIVDDPRRGRLLFAPDLASVPVIAARRQDSTRLFVGLLSTQAAEVGAPASQARLAVMSEMLVGGLAQAVSAWLDGVLVLERHELVDACAELFLAAGRVSG